MLETSTSPRRTGILDPVERFAGAVSVVIRPLGPQTRFVLRLGAEDAAMLGHLAGLQLAVPINRTSRAEGRIAARLGPDEWLLLAPEADALVFLAARAAVLAPLHHALVDISHRNVAIEVSGAAAADTLNAGCPLDLGAGRFLPGDATRTLVGKAEIVLLRLDDAADPQGRPQPRYRLECWRSYGRYLHAFLTEAATELA
jgi:sarcosine oxidase subunit gamma